MNLEGALKHRLFAGADVSWPTMLDAALTYAARWPVFPCGVDKKPRIPKEEGGNGFHDATSNVEQVREWWRRWPDTSIGIPTGVVSGFIVIDVDLRHDGEAHLAELVAKHGPLPATLESITGSGGRHLFFNCRGLDIRNSEGQIGRGLDVRGNGGYIVAPPSSHPSGNKYRWKNYSVDIADLPRWLEQLVLHPPRKKTTVKSNGTEEKIPKGQRNSVLTSLAGSMRRRAMTVEAIRAALWAENLARCEPRLPDADIDRIANSVGRYTPGDPPHSPPPDPSPPEECEEPSAAPPGAREEQEEEGIPGRLPITEVSNAERLVKRFRDEICYASDRRVWCTWNGSHWNVDDRMGIAARMQEVAKGIYSEAAREPQQELRIVLGKWAQKSESQTVQENSIDATRCHVEVRKFSEVFDTDNGALGVKNATVKSKDGTFGIHPHKREDFITKLAAVEHHAGARCPQFQQFLAETFHGSPSLIGYVTRLAGYFLTGHTTEQKWWMMYGPTASGKSTFVKILHGIMGDYALALPENYFLLSKNESTDFVTANLCGVRLATCIETNEGKRLNVARIKTLTGEDATSAALKYQNYFTFTPNCKLVLVTNYAPHVPAGDDALWRRLKVVPFTATVPEEKRIPGLAEKLLREESSGILNLFLNGWEQWQTSGLQEPKEVTEAVNQYRADEDMTAEFFSECLILDPDARTPKNTVYSKYAEWSKSEGIKARSKKYLGQELKRLGVAGDIDERHYLGIRLRQIGD